MANTTDDTNSDVSEESPRKKKRVDEAGEYPIILLISPQ